MGPPAAMKNAWAVDQSEKSPQLRSSPKGSNPEIVVAVGIDALVAVGCGTGVAVEIGDSVAGGINVGDGVVVGDGVS